MTLSDVLFVLIIFQLLLLSIFLITQQKGKQSSNRLLGFFFLAICLNLLDVFLLQTGVYFQHPAFAGFGSCLPLLFGPLLYFYTRSVIYKTVFLTSKGLIHFLPFLALLIGTETWYLIQPTEVQERILKDLSAHHLPAAVSFISALIFVQFLFYAIWSLRLVASCKRAAGELFSNPKDTDVSWLYSTIVFFILIIVISALNNLLAQTALAKYYLLAFNLVVFALLLFVMQVILKALNQPFFFSFADGDFPGHAASSNKTNSGSADKSEKEALMEIVLQFMKSDRPFLEPNLTLDQLASKMSLKPRVLSQAINEILQQNFFDFINRHRIEAAKILLTNPKDKKITILEVLYEVGFNSKSSFNTLFKKYTGLTPTEFRKKQDS